MSIEVFRTAEFLRVRDLPRRQPLLPSDAVKELTEYLKSPQGTQSLRPIQAQALIEAADVGALVAILGAGQGKTLLGALLPTILEAKRTLLLVPAKLREQTFDEWAKLQKHWRLLPLLGLEDVAAPGIGQVRVLSYESLSTVRFASFLNEYQPDLIICDEAHALARMSSARSKRVFRYIRERRRAGLPIKFIPMSGTLWRKSMREMAHILIAALQEGAPVPDHYPDLEQWCYALDEGVKDDARIGPGALLELCTAEEATQGIDGVRRAYRRRLIETPGIVATSESSVDLSLLLQVRHVEVPEAVRAAITRLRSVYELPNGDSVDSGISAWQHAREIACGFAYRWDPPAPEEWLAARRGWNTFVRDAIDRRVNGVLLDSPLQVWNAVAAGHFGDVPEWEHWKSLRGTFEPNPVPLWLSDYLVKDAEEWALKTGGIVWVGHSSAFTKPQQDDELGAGFTKIPYFGAGDERIRTHKGPCAASIRSHGTGKNLTQWNRALVMSMPSSGAALEQLLARHHRIGQEADEVTFEFYCHSYEAYDAFRVARNDARYIEAMSGNPQRVLSAVVLDVDGHSFSDERYEERIRQAEQEGDYLWSKK